MKPTIDFVARLKTREYLQEQVTEVREFLELSLGIKLTNIELVWLRRIAEQVIPSKEYT